jgi:hypothetical protein
METVGEPEIRAAVSMAEAIDAARRRVPHLPAGAFR